MSKKIKKFLIEKKLEDPWDIVDIFEKKGPTGKCPPLTPIYILYAEYLTSY